MLGLRALAGLQSLELCLWGYCRLMSSLWCSVVVFRLPLNAFFLVMVHGQTLIIKFQMPNFICHMSYVSHVKCQTDVSHVEFLMSNFRCFTCQDSDVTVKCQMPNVCRDLFRPQTKTQSAMCWFEVGCSEFERKWLVGRKVSTWCRHDDAFWLP